ncbi:hypothetical protein OC844_002389 [Tilletia horrida]|nr:hypothetical protein OC844_002389 [Tilletia horrida]
MDTGVSATQSLHGADYGAMYAFLVLVTSGLSLLERSGTMPTLVSIWQSLSASHTKLLALEGDTGNLGLAAAAGVRRAQDSISAFGILTLVGTAIDWLGLVAVLAVVFHTCFGGEPSSSSSALHYYFEPSLRPEAEGNDEQRRDRPPSLSTQLIQVHAWVRLAWFLVPKHSFLELFHSPPTKLTAYTARFRGHLPYGSPALAAADKIMSEKWIYWLFHRHHSFLERARKEDIISAALALLAWGWLYNQLNSRRRSKTTPTGGLAVPAAQTRAPASLPTTAFPSASTVPRTSEGAEATSSGVAQDLETKPLLDPPTSGNSEHTR